jgi:hypothetical protein
MNFRFSSFFVFLILLFFGGCNQHKVVERERKKTLDYVEQITAEYELELLCIDGYFSASRKQKDVMLDDLRDLIMMRGEPYKANYQLMMLDQYRAYPFLQASDDLDAKIKCLKRRHKFLEKEEDIKLLELLIQQVETLRKVIRIHSQFMKECKRYEKYRLIESAADFVSHEIEDLKDLALKREKKKY